MSRRNGTGPGRSVAASPALEALEYVVVDVETTGGSLKHGHRVTEIAALRLNGAGQVLDEFTTLVNPERPIAPRIVELTNITNEMVRDAPKFAEVADRVRAMLAGRVFVAHNVSFDWRFVQHELERATGTPLDEDGRRICTVKLARRVVPELSRRSLDVLADHFGVPNDARHRAYGDARATAVIFRRMLERLEARDVRSWAELQALLGRRKRKRRKKRRASPSTTE